jgi:uncharacterized membrane protein YbhN (UPF0104 family)
MRGDLLAEGKAMTRVAPTVVVQAISDFLSLALLATLVVPFYPAIAPAVLPVTVPMLTTVLAIATPPLREYLAGWKVVQWLASGNRREMLAQAGYLLGPKPTAVGLALGVPTMAIGGLGLYFAGVGIGVPGWTPFQAEGVYAMMQLWGGLSPLPQGLGVAEGSGAVLLSYLGVEPSQALAAVILFRAATLGLSVALGLLAFVLLRFTTPRVKVEQFPE